MLFSLADSSFKTTVILLSPRIPVALATELSKISNYLKYQDILLTVFIKEVS